MPHVGQDRLLLFAAGRADEREAEFLYEHLDACGTCGDRYRALRRIRDDFDGSWEEFLAEWGRRVEAAVSAEPVFTGLEVFFRGLLEGGRRLATASVERVSGSLAGLGSVVGELRPAYSGVADPAAGRAADLARSASGLCGEGRDAEAIRALEQAADIDPRAARSAELTLESEGGRLGRVVVDAGRRSVSVLVDPGSRSSAGEAVLIPESGLIPEMTVDLRPVPGARYLLAEFENVPTGSFALRLRLAAPPAS